MDINPPQLERAAAVQQRVPRNTKDERRFRRPRRKPDDATNADLAEDGEREPHQVDDVA